VPSTGRVQDHVAVVTGAAGGIGRAVTLRLAEEGALLIRGDVDAARLEQTRSTVAANSGTALSVVDDLTEASAAQALIDTAIEQLGRVDILVNVVGGGQPGRIWELPDKPVQ